MSIQSLEDKAARWQPVKNALEEHPAINDVHVNVGMPMDFDPAQGEVPKPDGVAFKLPNDDDLSAQKAISEVCDRFDLYVSLPDYKQPGYRARGRVYNEDAGYDAYVRLRPNNPDDWR